QVYTASISGTFGVEQAYDAYLKFNFTDCELLDATSDSLFDKLSENMMNAMPAHLAVVDSVPQYGHNLIIDGYNTDEFYHLNFGWGGSCNGWYQFPLHGMPYGMNIIEGIILDIGAGLQSIEENILENGTSILSLSIQSNPVSEYLEIGLSVSMQCTAEISVFDISGRKITTVARGEFSAGSHILGWDSSGLGKGVYVILAADSHGVVTAKFTVLHGDK
ncbi:MAG: C10 family peptidase, partial [FCB group bacterium]|nr:C10 family peptidase [FCB group bacterium]